MEPSAPGWYPDPYGRHERRYWSGIRWSRHVEDHGFRDQEPPPERPVLLQRRTSGPPPADRERAPRRAPVRRPIGVVAGGLGAVLLVAVGFVLLRPDGDDASDPVTAGDGRLVAAIADIVRDRSGNTLTDADAECMARAVIDSAGPARLDELGVLDGADPILTLEPRERDTAFRRAFGCLDEPGLVTFIATTWTEGGLSADVAPCVFRHWLDEVGRDRMVELYAASVQVDSPPFNELLAPEEFEISARAVEACVGPPSTTTPTTAAP